MKLSYSRISLYLNCPKQYEYACIKKIPRAISTAESFGSSVHNTLKKWGELELHVQTPKPVVVQESLFDLEPEIQNSKFEIDNLELTLETLHMFWEQSFIRSTYATKVQADAEYLRGKKVVTEFFTWWQQKERHVLTIESGFTLPIGNTIVTGRFDRIEESEQGLHIIDFKTNTPKDQQYVDEALQLSVYVLAAQILWQKPIASVSLLFTGQDEVIERKSTRGKEQLQAAIDQISRSATGIHFNEFAADPAPRKCNHCPYKNICKESLANT